MVIGKFWFWISLNMADQGDKFSFFRGICVRNNMRIVISISMKPKTTKFGSHVLLEKLSQIRLIKQVLLTSSRQDQVTLKRNYNFLAARGMIIKFGQENNKMTQLPFITSRDPSVTQFCGVMWQTKSIISPLSQCLGQPNFKGDGDFPGPSIHKVA